MNTIWIVLPILTLLMFDLGLSLRFEDFGRVFRNPWPIVVALSGQLILLPVLLGIGLHYAWPRFAEKTDKVLTKMAFPLLLLLITIFYIQHHRTILENIGILGLCVTALILLAIGCSSLLSRLVKNSPRQRRTVVIEVGMQNAAQAIAIASSPLVFANEQMAIPAILYSLMMNVVLLIYVGLVRRKDRKG